MIATRSAVDCLSQGDAALRAAVSNLLDAAEAFRRAGRADLAGPIRSAVTAARQAELLRASQPGGVPARDPTDWFLD